MIICDLKNNLKYLDEVALLEYEQWADNKNKNKNSRLKRKKERIIGMLDNPSFCKLLLIDRENLIGFISIFPKDGDEEQDLTPWYATMYVKKEYRGKGYSKLLNDAILKEAKKRKFKTIYLKTDLINYYEKFKAIYIKNLKSGEKLYKIKL